MSDTILGSAEFQDENYAPFIPEVRNDLRMGYSEELGYHGPPHEKSVVYRALNNRKVMIDHGVANVPGVFRTTAAASGHDKDYEEYFLKGMDKYFKSPEEYSMYKTALSLGSRGVDQECIDEVNDDQLGTKVGVVCNTPGRFLLCLADMHPTMQKNRDRMKADTKKLYKEHLYLKGEVSELEFNVLSIGVISTYAVVNLNNPEILKAVPEFAARRRQMIKNTLFMFHDTLELFGEQTIEKIQSLPAFLGNSILNLAKINRNSKDQAEA